MASAEAEPLYGGQLPWGVICTHGGLGMSENLTFVGLSHWSLKGACYESWANDFWELKKFFFLKWKSLQMEKVVVERMGSLWVNQQPFIRDQLCAKE